MDYKQARHVGDAGEARVAAGLAKLQFKHGFLVLHDVLLCKETKGKPITAQLDHVVIDEMGVLVIETKVRTNAQLRGTYADSKWTACYPNGQKATFQNPLRQNEQHLNLLHQLLKQFDPALSLDSVRGCVVFVSADISHLELDSVTSQRVQRVEDLALWFDDRYAFAIRTPMSRKEQAALGTQLTNLDHSKDPATAQAHAAYRGAAGQQTRSEGRPRPASASVWPSRKSAPLPTSVRTALDANPSGLPIRTLVVAGLVVAALLFLLWVVLGMINQTAPTWVYVALVVIAMVLGGETKSRGRRGRRTRSRENSSPATLGQRLLVCLLLFGILVAFVLAAPWFFRQVLVQGIQPGAAPIPQAVSGAPAVDVAEALRALKDADPGIYNALVEPNQPKTTVEGTNVSYEWSYLEKSTAASVRVKRIKITLDATGRIVGVTGS